jgi:hypothetical protein
MHYEGCAYFGAIKNDVHTTIILPVVFLLGRNLVSGSKQIAYSGLQEQGSE